MKTIKKTKRIVIELIQFIRCFISNLFGNVYLIRSKVIFNIKGKIIPNNFGDDINLELVKHITNKNVCCLPNNRLSYLFRKSYLVVGSTISFYSLNNVIIWGAGLRSEKDLCKMKGTPLEIRAVRGPLTRRELIKKGIQCPEVYGDPALLFPFIFKPNVLKRYKLGVICSYKHIEDEMRIIELLCSDRRTILINPGKYKNIESFISMINECEYIISFSLHGIIISEAYRIPNIWCKFENGNKDLEFKYYDFYESINKTNVIPYIINESTNINTIIEKAKEWKPGIIDLKQLLNNCPFELKKDIFNSIMN